LRAGYTIHGAGDREKYLYFPTSGLISRFYVMENGASVEVGTTGREGVIGIASFLGGETTPSQAVVLIPGDAYRLRTKLLNDRLQPVCPLLRVLLRYIQALITQTGQIAVCNRHHTVEQQLCCRLLICLDRLSSNELTLTQELIAGMLGVRREGVTEAAGHLQKAGVIRYSRGHITVLDRHALEARTCECYAVVKREYDRLLRPENSIGGAGMCGGWRQYGEDPAATELPLC
jgi:CRP-like cAMP-binding protein